MKTCSKCKIEQQLVGFYKDKTRKDGYHNECKKCCRQYRMDNPKYYKEYEKQHYIDNVEHNKQIRKTYRQSEQGKLVKKVSSHKRRALLKANTKTGKHFTPADIKLKLKLQYEKCIYCQINIKDYYEIDHIIPLCKNGSNEASNIQLLCKKCNGKGGKGTKLPTDYAQEHGMLV